MLTAHIEPNIQLIQIWRETFEIRTIQLTQAVNVACYRQMISLRLSLLSWQQNLLHVFCSKAPKNANYFSILIWFTDVKIGITFLQDVFLNSRIILVFSGASQKSCFLKKKNKWLSIYFVVISAITFFCLLEYLHLSHTQSTIFVLTTR